MTRDLIRHATQRASWVDSEDTREEEQCRSSRSILNTLLGELIGHER